MLSDFVPFHSVEPIGEPAVLMSVLSLLSRARGANYSLRNPERVALGLGAVQPTQMFVGMKTLRLCSVCTVTHGMRLQRGFSDCGNFSGDFSLVAPCCCLLTLVYPTMYCRL